MTNALAVIETINIVDLFNPEIIQPKLEAIRAQVVAEAETLDISTPGNRAAIASLSYKVGQSKTFVDKQRLALVADEKKRLKKIDQVGGEVWDYLETLQKEVRKPLTDWENADKDRIAIHESEIAEIEQCGTGTLARWNAYSAEAIRDRMAEIKSDDRDWEEFSTKAKRTISECLARMTEGLVMREESDTAAAELARLRAEAAEREQKEREERIEREAIERTERLMREREAKASQEAQDRERDAIDRAKRAEFDLAAARADAERDAAYAVEQERKRAEQDKAHAEAEQKAREKDFAHKAAVNGAAMNALVELGIDAETAKKVIKAIAKGSIPSCRMVY